MKYRTIVADPPWDVGRGPEWASNGASRPLTYPTMSVEEIAALPVRALAEKQAHLYIWTINAYVEETYEIARLWGFKPSTLLTWCKAPNGLGLGGTYSLTTEHVLFCRRGVLPAAERVPSTWWEWPRRRHSEKPDATPARCAGQTSSTPTGSKNDARGSGTVATSHANSHAPFALPKRVTAHHVTSLDVTSHCVLPFRVRRGSVLGRPQIARHRTAKITPRTRIRPASRRPRMTASVETFQRRQLRRFYQAAHTVLHRADDQDYAELVRLIRLVRLGLFPVADAHRIVADIDYRLQRDRRTEKQRAA